MEVGIITCMICMFAVALTVGGPIGRQASQSEKTVPVGAYVTLECPLVPDDLWTYVYWRKNDHTIYSLEVKSNTPWTNDTRYEGSNHATRLTITDLKKTDSGVYYCKVATVRFIKERGHVLLSVTDQEVGLSTTSPGVSSTIPPQPAEDSSIAFIVKCLAFIFITTIIIINTMYLFKKYRERGNRPMAYAENIRSESNLAYIFTC
ncbi:uncharacterized protein LOC105437875 [Strongylocentrotus purpuratus]|uniref:Ig-like domain-containing protein n=1 Tax=Strongylocentrotus purpuratus TaxID=7668 RepID=A0A7M7PET5_STRPU|nr:uncharacterized protein LOC105437875 [Strongylocentrotus purpuratus]